MKRHWRSVVLMFVLMTFMLFINGGIFAIIPPPTVPPTTAPPTTAPQATLPVTTTPIIVPSTAATTEARPEKEPTTQAPKVDTPLEILQKTVVELKDLLTGTITAQTYPEIRLVNQRLVDGLNKLSNISDVDVALTNLQDALVAYRVAYISTKQDVLIDHAEALTTSIAQNTQRLIVPETILLKTRATLVTLKTIDAVLLSSDKRIEVAAKRLIDASNRTVSTERITFTVLQNNNRHFTIDKIKTMPKAKEINAYHTALQADLTTFFGVNNVQVLERQVIFKLNTPKEDLGIKATIATDVAATLKLYNINKLAISLNDTTVTMPLDLFNDNKIVDLIMTFDYALRPAKIPQGGFAEGYVADITYYVDQKLVSTLPSPITLGFPISKYVFEGPTSPDQLGIYRFNVGKNVWLPVGGLYDPIGKTLTCIRDNLSQYTVLKSTKTFSDIGNTNAKNSINKLLNKGVIQGSTTFNPKANITREEFVGWIAKAYGLENKGAKPLPFTDVSKSSPYYDAIVVVYGQGIVGGKTATTFNPKGTVSKQEMAKILSTTLQRYQDKKVNVALSQKLQASAKNLPSWSVGGMSLMLELGLYSDADIKTNTAFVTKENAANVFGKIY